MSNSRSGKLEYESAANEVSVASRGSVRRRYQDLAEVQHRATVLCEEYSAARDERRAEAAKRLQRLSQTFHLLEQLSRAPTLEQGCEMIKEAERNGQAAPEWLRGFPAEGIVDKAFEAHFRTAHSMGDTGSWCLVAAPYDVTGPPIDMARLAGECGQGGVLGRNKGPMRARSGRWVTGEDLEHSLWWVSYATQRSKYAASAAQQACMPPSADVDDAMAHAYEEVTGLSALRQSDHVDADGAHVPSAQEASRAATNAALGIVHGAELLKKVARDVLAAPRRLDAVRAHCLTENKRADALASVYTQQVMALQIKQRHDARRRLLSAREIQDQEKATVKIQSLARRRRAAERVGALQAERRVGRALQVLLQELGRQQGLITAKGSGGAAGPHRSSAGHLVSLLCLGAKQAEKASATSAGKVDQPSSGKHKVVLPFPPSGHGGLGTPSRPAYSGASRNMHIKPSPRRDEAGLGAGLGADTPGGDSMSTLDMSLTPGMGPRTAQRGGTSATVPSSRGKENSSLRQMNKHAAAASIQRLYHARSPSKARGKALAALPEGGQLVGGNAGGALKGARGGTATGPAATARGAARDDCGALVVSFEAQDDSRGSIDSPLSMASADPRMTEMGYVSSPSETMSQSQVSLTLFASPGGKKR